MTVRWKPERWAHRPLDRKLFWQLTSIAATILIFGTLGVWVIASHFLPPIATAVR